MAKKRQLEPATTAHLFYYSSHSEPSRRVFIGGTNDLDEKFRRDTTAFKKYKGGQGVLRPFFPLFEHGDVEMNIIETYTDLHVDPSQARKQLKDMRDQALAIFHDDVLNEVHATSSSIVSSLSCRSEKHLSSSRTDKSVCEYCGIEIGKKSLKRHQASNAYCLKIQNRPSPNVGKRGYCCVCGHRASFGTAGQRPIHCKKHAEKGEQNVVNRRCTQHGCKQLPSHGLPGHYPIHCPDHATEGEQDLIVGPHCAHTGCKAKPSHGLDGKEPIHCAAHAKEFEHHLIHSQCVYPGCTITSSYGPPGQRPQHCSRHAEKHEENLRTPRCSYPDCKTTPSFGPSGKPPRHCALHALDGEENLRKTRCKYPGCPSTASYGIPGKSRTHCAVHATEGEENIVKRRCTYPECKAKASYGFPGTQPIHCEKHSTELEENVVSTRCSYPGCNMHPSFALPGQRPIHCLRHASEGEENVCALRCIQEDCFILATYGPPGGRAIHCFEHADKGEEPRRSSLCSHQDCKSQRTHGLPGQRPMHCRTHAHTGEENMVQRRCAKENCNKFATSSVFCTVHHPNYIQTFRNASKIGCEFIDHLASELGLANVQHIHYNKTTKSITGDEFLIPLTRYHADGFFKQEDSKKPLPFDVHDKGVVVEFHGNLWHGFPDGKKSDECNYLGDNFGDLYQETMERMRKIKELGYTIVYIWENEFQTWKKQYADHSLLQFCHFM